MSSPQAEIPDDINSGLRVFSKQETLPFFSKLCDTFSFTTSLTLAYMMNGKFVQYLLSIIKREGKTKVRLFRDSMRTLQFITEAILFYNPIKIFIVFSSALVMGGTICIIIAALLRNPVFTVFGIGFIFLSILMFGIGLVSVQLKHILSSNENRRSG
ncbi:MAG: hypothetical protein R3A12_19300 [Ignavibacteria bacterium]